MTAKHDMDTLSSDALVLIWRDLQVSARRLEDEQERREMQLPFRFVAAVAAIWLAIAFMRGVIDGSVWIWLYASAFCLNLYWYAFPMGFRATPLAQISRHQQDVLMRSLAFHPEIKALAQTLIQRQLKLYHFQWVLLTELSVSARSGCENQAPVAEVS